MTGAETKTMIRQITLIRFKPGVETDQIQSLTDGFCELAKIVPTVARFEFGPDLEIRDDTWDYALVIDFPGEEALYAYRDHPTHLSFVDRFMPLIDEVARVQYSVK
tara:strand:+ start:196 stop:513 length:318 start_codon:yes stop_codon:yes gene_type:complete